MSNSSPPSEPYVERAPTDDVVTGVLFIQQRGRRSPEAGDGMHRDRATIRIAPALTLRAPDGSDVEIHDVQATITHLDDQLREVELAFVLRPDVWTRVDAGGWFSMPADARSPCFGGGFAPDKDVEVDARLGTDALTLLALTSDGLWDVGGQIRGARDNPSLHTTEAWLGLVVKQQMGPIKGGFSTHHRRV